MHTMYDVMGVLSSAVAVAEVGFVLPPPHAAVGSWEAGEVEMQDCFALLFYKYCTSLVGNRLLSEMWWLNGWPLQSALFTSDSRDARAAVQFLRIAFGAFKSFEEFATRHAGLTQIAKRSVFHRQMSSSSLPFSRIQTGRLHQILKSGQITDGKVHSKHRFVRMVSTEKREMQ